MAVDLRDTNIDPSKPEYRKMLENLQANILKPHGRKESDHLVIRFTAEPQAVRTWIREFARREVTSARKQLDETGTYHDHGTRGGLVASFALSAKGYGALGLLAEDFDGSGQSFRNGMKLRAFSLIARNRDPPPNEWEAPYQGDIHALVSLSHDSADELAAKTREVSTGLRDIAEILTVERGTVLRNARGDPIEHFGYVDSRSQPLFFQADLDADEAAGGDDRHRSGEQFRVPRPRPGGQSMSVPRPHPEGEPARGQPVPESGTRAQPSGRAPRRPIRSSAGTSRGDIRKRVRVRRSRPPVSRVP